jgi:hypothetical protein
MPLTAVEQTRESMVGFYHRAPTDGKARIFIQVKIPLAETNIDRFSRLEFLGQQALGTAGVHQIKTLSSPWGQVWGYPEMSRNEGYCP